MDWLTAVVTVLTQGWPVAAIVGIVAFRKDLRSLIPRIRKAGPVELDANDVQPAPPSLPGSVSTELKALPGLSRTPTLEKLETLIRQQLAALPANESQDRMIYALAEANLAVAFERTYRTIFGSQIEALKLLNTSGPMSEAELLPLYEAAVAKSPDFYRGYPFEKWLGFLRSADLVQTYEGMIELSDSGKDFLRFLTNLGYPENKAG